MKYLLITTFLLISNICLAQKIKIELSGYTCSILSLSINESNNKIATIGNFYIEQNILNIESNCLKDCILYLESKDKEGLIKIQEIDSRIEADKEYIAVLISD